MANVTDTKRDQQVGRMLAAKRVIRELIHPNTEYMPHFVLHFPEWDTPELKVKVRNCWNLTTMDDELLDLFERLPELIKNHKKSA